MNPVRVTAVLTHPIQYHAAWFRHVTATAPELELTVVYAIEPEPDQQGVGFGRPFAWDVPLRQGYRSSIVRAARPSDRIDSTHFFGLDVPEIGDAVLRTEPDVAIVFGWYSAALVRALRACRRHRVPVLYRGDSNLLSGPAGLRRVAWSLRTRALLRQFDGYLSPGTRSDAYLRHFGVPPYRLFSAPQAVDNHAFETAAAPFTCASKKAEVRSEWGVAADAFVVLFTGKLVDFKQPLAVVEAAARMSPVASVVIAGAGALEPELRREAARLGVPLTCLGFVNQTGLGRVYAAADCLVLPSNEAETWGLVVNEALATGLPAIVSDRVGCAPDLIVEGKTGYVFPCGDIEALAERLSRVREQAQAGFDFANSCRQVAATYSFAVLTPALVHACRSVLPRSTGPKLDPSPAPTRVIAPCGSMVAAGGLERMSFNVLRVLRERGARVHCIVNSWENHRISALADAADVTWSAGPYWYPLRRRGLTPVVLGRMLVEMARVSANLLAESRCVRPTHVFVPDFVTVLRTAPALALLRSRGVRVVLRIGNAPEPGTFYRNVWRFGVAPFVDIIVAISGFVAGELRGQGIPGRKIRLVPNMVKRPPPSGRTSRVAGRIAYVGQVIPEKGLHILLDAVSLLRSRGIDATLDVIGNMDGWESPSYSGYREGIRRRAAQADLAGAVRFLGWRDDVTQDLDGAVVHCCPSLPAQREAFGNVVLEAKAAGVPSVVSSTGNLPSLIHHRVDGWVCDDLTAAALAEGLAFFLTDPAAAADAAAAARRSADAYAPEAFARRWNEVFGCR